MSMVSPRFFVSSEEVVSNIKFRELQFATSSTFKGTQSQHQFIPNASSLSLTMKKTFATRSREISQAECGSSKMQVAIEDIKPVKFYLCQYENDWYFCVVNYASSEHVDVNMKFLHPKGFSENFLGHNVMMSVGLRSRMYTVKLMHLQLAVLDCFIVLTKNSGKYCIPIPASVLFIIVSVHIFPLVYSYSFILKLVENYLKTF